MKRGIVFSKYGTLAASTRQRFVQTIPHLKAAQIEIDIYPLFDNAYLEQLFTHAKRDTISILTAYCKRMLTLLTCRKYDFLWVHCELFPYLPSGFESLIRLANKPTIYDFDDAIFHQYDKHTNRLVRRILGNKLHPLLRHADLAFCGNAYLATYAKSQGAPTEIIPTTVDTSIYVPQQKLHTAKPVLGWIGSPSTWQYCLPLAEVFTSFATTNQLDILVVGAGHAATRQHPFEFRDWEESREIADIQQMDIGVMPIPNEPWARGKCGYKLIQYMACGIPVIASPVGVNCEIVEHGVNGFLASTANEWRTAIAQLLADHALRQRMGQAGRITAQTRYSIQQYGPKIAALIQQL